MTSERGLHIHHYSMYSICCGWVFDIQMRVAKLKKHPHRHHWTPSVTSSSQTEFALKIPPKKVLHFHRKEKNIPSSKPTSKPLHLLGWIWYAYFLHAVKKLQPWSPPFQHSSWETFFLLCIKALIALQNCVISPLLIYWKWKNWKFL